jgi:hypothetical protein
MLTAFIILFLIFLLLIIPVEIYFEFNNSGNSDRNIYLTILFGLFRFKIYTKNVPETKITKAKKSGGKSSRSDVYKYSKLLRNSKLLDKIYCSIRSFLYSLKPSINYFYLRLGLTDPADTGLLWGIMGPISGILYGLTDKDLVIEPDFLETAFELQTEGKITIIPLEIIFISLGFLLSPTVIKTYWFDLRGAR